MALGETSKRKKTTAADLPEVVLTKEILTRLPIKSVVRFKCVAKSWLSLFSDPEFVKDHLTRSSTQNPNQYDCLIVNKLPKFVILSRYKETCVLSSGRFDLIGSINGLVCLGNNCRKLSLWNPAIHQSKEFTLPSHCPGARMNNIALGFDYSSNDYKIVVLSRNRRSASVYSSNSDTWIELSVPDYVFPENEVYYTSSPTFHSSSPTTLVRDCPYWTFSRYTKDEILNEWRCTQLIAVKFDAGNNEFKLLPEFHRDVSARENDSSICDKFVNMKDRLTLMVHHQNSTNCMVDIYYLDEGKACCVWSKMYSLGPLNFHTRDWYVSLSQGFKYGGEIVFSDDGMFSCYDNKTDTIKHLLGTTSSSAIHSCQEICFTYTPSLVFLEGMKSVHLTTQTHRAPGLCYRTPQRLINSLMDSSFA